MKNLNQAWLALIIIGILSLILTIFYRVYESFDTANEDVNTTVIQPQDSPLLPETLQEHFRNAPDF